MGPQFVNFGISQLPPSVNIRTRPAMLVALVTVDGRRGIGNGLCLTGVLLGGEARCVQFWLFVRCERGYALAAQYPLVPLTAGQHRGMPDEFFSQPLCICPLPDKYLRSL